MVLKRTFNVWHMTFSQMNIHFEITMLAPLNDLRNRNSIKNVIIASSNKWVLRLPARQPYDSSSNLNLLLVLDAGESNVLKLLITLYKYSRGRWIIISLFRCFCLSYYMNVNPPRRFMEVRVDIRIELLHYS